MLLSRTQMINTSSLPIAPLSLSLPVLRVYTLFFALRLIHSSFNSLCYILLFLFVSGILSA